MKNFLDLIVQYGALNDLRPLTQPTNGNELHAKSLPESKIPGFFCTITQQLRNERLLS